jgi:hypothetical protein
MTGQVTGHQSPHETGGAEHHDIELTIHAHQLILGKQLPGGRVAHARYVPYCRCEDAFGPIIGNNIANSV